MGITNAKITNLTIETAKIGPLLPIQEEIKGRRFKKGGKRCSTSLINKNNS